METVNLITSLISSVGFPVVVAGSKLCGLIDKLMDKLGMEADDSE